MTFLPRAIYLDMDDMVKFILAIPVTGWTWAPKGITWHNTGAPTLREWDDYPQPVKDAWGDNLDHYYRFDEGWHAGPHAAGTPDKGIVLGEFRANGVHASCWNSDRFGIETVGDFRTGSDDPFIGRGLLSMQSSANIVAALCKRMGWQPRAVINFHRECTRDGHACPGNLVTDEWAIRLAETRFAQINGLPAPTPSPAPPAPSPVPAAFPTGPLVIDPASVSGIQQALNAIGAHLKVDADFGPLTKDALRRALRMRFGDCLVH